MKLVELSLLTMVYPIVLSGKRNSIFEKATERQESVRFDKEILC